MSLFRASKPAKKVKKKKHDEAASRLVIPMAFATAVAHLYSPSGRAGNARIHDHAPSPSGAETHAAGAH